MTQTISTAATTSDGTQLRSEQIVEAVADAAGVSELELQPLYDVIDPDALERLFQAGANGSIRFIYHGHRVVVSSDGDVTVDER